MSLDTYKEHVTGSIPKISANPGDALAQELRHAQCYYLSVSTYLTEEAVGEGDPGRIIAHHPDYIAAVERLENARMAIGGLVVPAEIEY